VRVESSLPQQELVWLGASAGLVAPKRSEGGWPPAMTLPAGGKQLRSLRALKTAAAKIILGWTIRANCLLPEIKFQR